jgi:hypothetical protein
MNKSKPVTLLSVILVLISGCAGDLSRTVKEGLPDTVDGYERVSWEFIQSVGGMAIGDPVYDRKDNQILLPLIHDFTGKSKITLDPVLIGSGKACHHTSYGTASTPLGTVLDIQLIAWSSDEEVLPPYGCDIAFISLRFVPPSITRFRVWYRDSRFQLNGHYVGEFTL